MCELLGISFAQPISADFSLCEFEHRDAENSDGWGLAWYTDASVSLVKEPKRWGGSKHSVFLENYPDLCARIYIGHVRRKSTGRAIPTHADTHPFVRELGGREFCFAHNGTIDGPFWELPLGRFRPVGATDSEHLFCHLLEEIAGKGPDWLAKPDGWIWLHSWLNDMNKRGEINCLLSDGERLFCYHDINGWKGLAVRKVYLPDTSRRSFGDPEIRFDLASAGVNHGFVVATQPLSATGWTSFEPGELMVIAGGLVRLSNYNLELFTAFSKEPRTQ